MICTIVYNSAYITTSADNYAWEPPRSPRNGLSFLCTIRDKDNLALDIYTIEYQWQILTEHFEQLTGQMIRC